MSLWGKVLDKATGVRRADSPPMDFQITETRNFLPQRLSSEYIMDLHIRCRYFVPDDVKEGNHFEARQAALNHMRSELFGDLLHSVSALQHAISDRRHSDAMRLCRDLRTEIIG